MRRKVILFLVASSTFLLPVTDTVYLPSLTKVRKVYFTFCLYLFIIERYKTILILHILMFL